MNAPSAQTPFDHHQIKPITRNMPTLSQQHSPYARFVMLSPPLRGLEMTLQGAPGQTQWTIGACGGVDFYIHDPSLLDIHLFIERCDDHWMITCHPDCWGMLVNLEPVQMAVIENGDRIIVGRFELVFVEASFAA